MGAIDRVFRGRRPAQQRPAAAIVAGLWKNSEQGVWYDPSDLATMYQDWAGTTPIYAPGKGQVDPPVGLLLDKRLGAIKGPELWDDASVGLFGEASRVSPGVYRVYTSAGAYTAVQISGLIAGEWYELSLNVDLITTLGNGLACDVTTPVASFNSLGPKKYLLRTNTNVIAIKRNANVTTDIQISNVSVRRISGNHAFQSTTTSRPTLSGRYNLLTNTDSLSSGWSTFNGAFALEGAYWKFTENTSNSLHSFLQTPSQTKAASYRASFVGKPAGRSIVQFVLNAYSGNFCEVRFNLASGTVTALFTGGDGVVESYSIVPVGDGAYRCTIVGKPSAAAAGTAFDVSLGMMADGATPTYLGDGVSSILVNNFDCRSSTDGAGLPSYQKVVGASTYDTAGFPLYLNFDGVDDWLQTTSVDFSSATAVSAFAAVRKLSDASRGVIVELGASGPGAPGSFNIEQAWFSPNFSASYSGSAGSATTTKPGIASPVSAVLSAVFDRIAPVVRLRYQGQEASQNSAAVGAGTFLNAVVYVARRGGASSPAKVRLYGLVIRAGSIANSQISAVEKLLNQIARIY